MEFGSRYSCAKPPGGFVFISVPQVCFAWSSYRQKSISLLDLRVWVACWELMARRCVLPVGRTPHYSISELSRILGGIGQARVRRSLRSLERESLLKWSSDCLEMHSPDRGEDRAIYHDMIREIANSRRRIPIPRRTLRLLAGTSRKVVFATILGHLLRCLYYRSGRCEALGSCKASWVASVFGVDARNVKAARSWLAEIGWLSRQVRDQWHLNRYGGAVGVELQWEGHPKSSPPVVAFDTKSPPPESDRKLLTESENQKPAVAVRTGVLNSDRGRGPTLVDVKREDLGSIVRLTKLHREAVSKGLARGGEAGILVFAGAAVHAVRTAKRNPCGLFATIVRRGMWYVVTQADEDHARRKLAGYYNRAGRKPFLPGASAAPSPESGPAVTARPQHVSALLAQLTTKQLVQPSKRP